MPRLELTAADLDEMGCAECGEKEDHEHKPVPLVFHSKCHPAAPTWATYKSGKLRIECAECRTVVAVLGVK